MGKEPKPLVIDNGVRAALDEAERKYRTYWLTLSPRDRERLPTPKGEPNAS